MHQAQRHAVLASALTLASALATGASSQSPGAVGPWTDANPAPMIGDPFRTANEAAQYAPQLFTFAGLSNKSGNPGCIPSAAQASGRPRVVATFPTEGAVVRPGLVVVRVTFDQPMACDASFDGTSDLPNPCPGRWRETILSQDRRSFRTVCEVQANRRYRLTLHSFRSAHGLAVPAEITFSTSGSAPIATIQQALAEDAGFQVAGG